MNGGKKSDTFLFCYVEQIRHNLLTIDLMGKPVIAQIHLGKPAMFYHAAAAAKLLQSCPTLCDPMDCSLPGSSIHRIFQATVLEWGAIAFSHIKFVIQQKLHIKHGCV